MNKLISDPYTLNIPDFLTLRDSSVLLGVPVSKIKLEIVNHNLEVILKNEIPFIEKKALFQFLLKKSNFDQFA